MMSAAKPVTAELTQAVSVEPGEAAPTFTVTELLQTQGETKFDWQSLRGKVVVVEFWATWCGPCVGAIPHINDLAKELPSSKFCFISITDEDKDTVTKFLSNKPINTWIGLVPSAPMFKNWGRPTTLVVDAEGKIAMVNRPDNIHAQDLLAVAAGTYKGPRKPKLDDPPWIQNRPYNDEAPLYRLEIHPTKYPDGGGILRDKEKCELYNFSLSQLMAEMYDTRPARVVIPENIPKSGYDAFAKIPGATRQQAEDALKDAVLRGFKLAANWEQVDADVLVINSGSALQLKSESADLKTGHWSSTSELVNIANESMDTTAEILERVLMQPVVNETQLKGKYTLIIPLSPGSGASRINNGLEKLGLTVRAEKRNIKMLVLKPIDYASR
jgi:uncharacterized protein (TIGR03435 family)